jgi:hypothetical protein
VLLRGASQELERLLGGQVEPCHQNALGLTNPVPGGDRLLQRYAFSDADERSTDVLGEQLS